MTDSTSTCGPHNQTIVVARVLYADTDKMGVDYHANNFRWFEAGRGAYMRRRGLAYSRIEAGGIQLPLVECGIRYHRSALYEDLLTVRAWVTRISAVQVEFQYEIARGDELLVTGFTRHATINGENRPVRVPDDLVAALNSAENTPDVPY